MVRLKELEKLSVALNNLLIPDRWKIIQLLKEINKPVSYSEIKKQFGKNYNDNMLWRHLKSLKEADLIEQVKGLVEHNPETGKIRVSFYKLSSYGKALLEKYLAEIIQMHLTLTSELEEKVKCKWCGKEITRESAIEVNGSYVCSDCSKILSKRF